MPGLLGCLGVGGGPSSLLANLSSYWKLEEASGTRVDQIGNNSMSATNAPGNAAGKVGQALLLASASSQYLSVADNATNKLTAGSFTIAGWLLFNSINAGGGNAWLAKDSSTAGRAYNCDQNSNNFRFFTQGGGGSNLVATTGVAIATATWYFVACWFDSVAGSLNIQVNNGTIFTQTGAAGPAVSTAPLNIGQSGYAGSNAYWDGEIDEVGIWTKVLSASQRTNLYNSGAGTTYPFVGIP